jgi:hypothetical protein
VNGGQLVPEEERERRKDDKFDQADILAEVIEGQ